MAHEARCEHRCRKATGEKAINEESLFQEALSQSPDERVPFLAQVLRRSLAKSHNDLGIPSSSARTRRNPSGTRHIVGQSRSGGRPVAEVAELTKNAKWNSGQWYNFACVCAVASGKSADKKQEYADRAMDLLQTAVKAGWSDAAHMAKDTDLDPIRGRDDFKKLIEELAKKSPANSEPKP